MRKLILFILLIALSSSSVMSQSLFDISPKMAEKSTMKEWEIFDYVWQIPYDWDKYNKIMSGNFTWEEYGIYTIEETGKGVCLDKAALMAKLLALKGIDSYVICYKVNGYAHAIVYYKGIYSDPTSGRHYDSVDNIYLILKPEVTYELGGKANVLENVERD